MTTYAIAWTVCMTVACFVVLAVVVGLEIRDHRAAQKPDPAPIPPRPSIPAQRQPSAAAIVTPDAAAYEAFLRELILTPHVEDVLA